MSCNREHIAWREDDGTISVGFYGFEYINTEADDFDHEWDVIYDYDSFCSLTRGLRTIDEVADHGPNGNPGHVYFTEHPEEVAKAKELAEKFDRENPPVRYVRRNWW